MEGRSEHRIWYSVLAGESVPEDFTSFWREFGALAEATETGSQATPGSDPATLHLTWVGDRWQEGMELLDSFPQSLQISTALCGLRPRAADGPAIRQRGGLGFVAWPPPPWLPSVLLATVERLAETNSGWTRQLVHSLQQRVEPLPQKTLVGLAALSHEYFSAAMVQVFLPRHDSTLQGFARWPQRPSGEPPDESAAHMEKSAIRLARRVVAQEDQVLHPHLPQESAAISDGPALAAAGVPMIAPGLPSLGALVIVWASPLLLHQRELEALELLATFAASAASHHVGRQQLSLQQGKIAATLANTKLKEADFNNPKPKEAHTEEVPNRDQATRYFVQHLLQAHNVGPGPRRLWARVSASSLGTGSWIGTTDPKIPGPPPQLTEIFDAIDVENLQREEVIEQQAGDRYWVIQQVGGEHECGFLAAEYSDREQVEAYAPELGVVAADLKLGLELLRSTADSAALMKLARIFASTTEAEQALGEMIKIIRREMSSDGAKVVVVCRSPTGFQLELLCQDPPVAGEPVSVPLRPGEGLVQWVLENDDWLLIPEGVLDEETGQRPEVGISGRQSQVRVLARQEGELHPEQGKDNEQTMLLVPLASAGKTAGVLSVWRTREDGIEKGCYDKSLDAISLRHFASHVASACVRQLQLRKTRQELTELAKLDKALSQAQCLEEAYRAVAHGARKLADASLAILLTFDGSNDDTGDLFTVAIDSEQGIDADLELEVKSSCLACRPEVNRSDAVRGHFTDLLKRFPKANLELGEVIPDPRKAPITGRWLVLLRPRGGPVFSEFVGRDWLHEQCASFLRHATAMLERHIAAFATTVIEKIVEHGTEQQLLARAAEEMQQAFDVDATIVYGGRTLNELKITHVWPERPELIDQKANRGPLTAESFKTKKPHLVLRVDRDRESSQPILDHQALERLQEQLGWWQGVSSWLCCPLVREGRQGHSIGLIKLLSKEGGQMLSRDHQLVAQRLAEWAAQEMLRIDRQQMVSELNQLAERLAPARGAQLGRKMVKELSKWADRYIAPGTPVAVFAHINNKPLLRQGSSDLEQHVFNELKVLSQTKRAEAPQFLNGEIQERMGWHGLRAPIRLGGDAALRGDLFFLSHKRLTSSTEDAAKEAAREMALLLNMEKLRHEWERDVALFEHALLGPVQGLQSMAQVLGRLARRAEAEEKQVERCIRRIDVEKAFIASWRASTRLRRDTEIQVVPYKQVLKPIVQRCFDRFRGEMTKRNIEYKLRWTPAKPLFLAFDADALDLALSNLLDNAAKYAFFNREVTLEVATNSRGVAITVEDIGQGIPEKWKEAIYQANNRVDLPDPFRAIPGQGLGLALAQAVAQGHGTKLTHSSEPVGIEPGLKRPYRVRFTLELPWRTTARGRQETVVD